MRILLILTLAAGAAELTPAQEKKKETRKEPAVALILPLGAQPGAVARLTVRGFGLDQAKEATLSGRGKVKIISKGPAAVPDKNADKLGDTQVVLELVLDEEAEEGTLHLSITTPAGTSKPHPLIVDRRMPAAEKEPNPGFREAQPIKRPTLIEGVVGVPRDVDVYRIEGKAGQKIRAEVFASRYGSPLDAMLTLYDARSAIVASADDKAGSRDAYLEATLPADGVYYLSLIDAHDTGSALHVYRLLVR